MKQLYTRGPKMAYSVLVLACLLSIGLYYHFFSSSRNEMHFSTYEDGTLAVKTGDLDLKFSIQNMVLNDEWQLSFEDANSRARSLLTQSKQKTDRFETTYSELYPKSDWRIYDKGNGRMAYDFILKPGADINDIRMRLDGNGEAYLNKAGELVLPTPEGEIRHTRPFAYQEGENGAITEVESRFLLADGKLGFELGDYQITQPVIIDPEIYFVSHSEKEALEAKAMMMACCPENILLNPSFENNSYTFNQNFPNATLSPTPNSVTTTAIDEWFYDDGAHFGSAFPIIQDAARASDGDYFVYIPDLGPTGGFHRCLGDALPNAGTSGTCPPTGSFNTGLRYVMTYNYVIFNPSVPDGGPTAGQGRTAMEYIDGGGYTPINVYDENGNPLTAFEPAVGWDDIATSWKTAYALTSSLSGSNINLYFSNDVDATAGMLIDNIYVAPLQISAPGIDNVDCGASADQITFTLNPTSNLAGATLANYTISAPAGYTVSPTVGTYGMETAFTLTNNSGNFTPGSPVSVDLELEDEVNTNCTVIATIVNPYPCCPVPTATVLAGPATCDGYNSNNDGTITVTAVSNADKYGISPGTSYSGPGYALATDITAGSFEVQSSIPGTGGTYTIRFFNAEDACYYDEVVMVPAMDCLPPGGPACTAGVDVIGGIVWVDADNNGEIGTGEIGQRAVQVEVFECENETPVATVWTNSNGEWSVSGLNNYPYRIEFSNPIYTNLQNSALGPDNGSNVQYADAAGCEHNFGLIDPADYCQTNPLVAVVCFTRNNDPDSESTVVFINEGDARDFPGPALATDADGRWGIPSGSSAANYPLTAQQASNVGEIGTTFGMDWDKLNTRLFTGSYMRAFAKMGTNGSANGFAEAAIYQIPLDIPSETAGTPSVWLDLENLFGDDFAGTFIDDATYPGPAVFGRTSANPNLIGYTGLGSIKVASDYSEIYTVNLKTREVLVIPIGPDGSAPTTTAEIKRFPLPDSECAGTWPDGRPLASVLGLGVHPGTGRVYATLTCAGPTLADVTGYVYSFDPGDATPDASDFNLELAIPLNINRPATSPNTARFWGQTAHAWESVTPNNVFYTNDPRTGFSLGNEFNVQHNQPWLAEVAFDPRPDGTYGMIVAERNRYHDLINGSFYVTGGVLFRACGGEGSWNLESNGACGDYTSAVNWTFTGTRAGVYTSPNSRFFKTVGREGTMGAGTLTMHPGSSDVIMPVMDNLFNSATSGITWLRTNDGERSRDIRILGNYQASGYDNTNFTKSNNWGAIAAMCEELPVELGNYVWNDADKDGIQDPCEDPIVGFTIKLYSNPSDGADPVLLATTTTDAEGIYSFAGDGRDAATWETPNDVIRNDSSYYIVLCGDSYDQSSNGITLGATNFRLTDANIGEGNRPDLNDSNAEILTLGSLGDFPAISVTATITDHTLDVGLKESKMSLGNFVWEDINNNSMYDPTDPDFPEAGLPNVAISLFADEDMDGIPDGDALQQTTTDADGFYIFTALSEGKYLVGVDSANFSPGGALEIFYVSSYITEGDANLDVDQKDNGANVTYTPVIYSDVLSTTVELIEDNEPDTETFFGPDGDGGATPENSNLTVDFGFFLDCDGDGVSDQIENAAPDGDRDNDGLPNECDYDPAGYIYCELNGETVTGGTISIVSTPLGGEIEIIRDGSDGWYQFFTNGIAGVYEFTYNPPTGYTINANCNSADGTGSGSGGAFDPSPGSGDNPDGNDPVVLGQGDMDGGEVELNDFDCTENPYYFTFELAAGDPIVFNNNIPLTCPCDLEVTNVDVDCNNGSEFTINVDVEWVDSDLEGLSDDINVTINGQTLSASASGSTGNLTVGPFTVSEPEFGVAVSAAFAGDPDCSDQSIIDLLACTPACVDLPEPGEAVGGTVWLDGNQDGTFDDGVEVGQGNILVEIYNCNNDLVCSTWSNEDGAWSCAGLTPDEEYRVEFSSPLTDWLEESFAGSDNGTNVQFVTPGDCTVDYGLIDPNAFCNEPFLLIPCYENGSGVGNSNPVLVSLDYEVTGTGSNTYVTGGTAANVGSVWGVAYDRFHQVAYTSAFLKRQTGLGPLGTGGIYAVDYSSSAPGSLIGSFDLNGIAPANGGAAIDLGAVNRNLIASGPGNGDNDLSADRDQPSLDLDAFGKVGKTGFGDIDVDQNTQTLWAVNLNQRALIAIDLTTATLDALTGASVRQWLIRDVAAAGPTITGAPNCTDGTLRPFALKIHQGKGYLGAVCDASGSATVDGPGEQIAYVLSFDLANPTSFTEVLSFPLNYIREKSWVPFSPGPGFDELESDQWQRWMDTWTPAEIKNGIGTAFQGAPQPILADIEFLDDGSMVLGLMDRFANQQGWENYTAESGSTTASRAVSHGDILLAYNTGFGFELEGPNANDNLTGVPAAAGAAFRLDDGPSRRGEYFYQDGYIGSDATHPETALGGLAVLSGSDEVTAVSFDPMAFNSQGVRWFTGSTGAESRNYEIVAGGLTAFGKGAGLGDVEIVCGLPPVEIGNYAWIDFDEDGIQDACEDPLPNLTVKLYSKPEEEGDPELLATTTTDANGNYYFAGPGLDDATWIASDPITRGATYYIVFCGEAYDADTDKITVDGLPYTLTTTDVVEGDNPDLHDSDASELTLNNIGDLPAICITVGSTDHSQDAGFLPPYDYGDLPATYPLTLADDNGPQHLLSPGAIVKLGDLVDPEDDGQPSNTAGETVNDGDNGNGVNDEDGVIEPIMIFEGETAEFQIAYVNEKTEAAKLVGFVDWNGDGQFDGPGEMLSETIDPVSSGTVSLTFQVPLDGATYTDIGARFRISTDQDAVMAPTGIALDGEVEDYLVLVKEVDYGDLPDPSLGAMMGNYQTLQEDDGARHGVPETPEIYLGSAPDTENDGNPDMNALGDGPDEDGATLPPMFFAGEEVIIPVSVTNNTVDAPAKLIVFIDWNGDGVFSGADEMRTATIAAGTISGTENVSFTVPNTATINQDLGLRIRISSDPDFMSNMPPNGFAMDGEVEDYLVRVKGVDYGDLPAAYDVSYTDDGPRHGLPEDPTVFLGMTVDPEPVGINDPDAEGDDNTDDPDEDGVSLPAMIFQGEQVTFNMTATNQSGSTAKVVGWVDWNNNDELEASEMVAAAALLPNGSVDVSVPLVFTVPLNAVPYEALGARFRISTDQDFIDNMLPTGFAMDGEVEDYLVTVKGLDFGDLPDGFDVSFLDDGPRHGIPETPEVYFGEGVDNDIDGTNDESAAGDDNSDDPDEDGVELPAMLFQGEAAAFTVTATNESGVDAKIVGWVDWNDNGAFEASEMMAAAELLPDGSVDEAVEIVFSVPLDAVYHEDLGVRFRISTDPAFIADMSPVGFLMDGEVEDYLVTVKPLDYGDLPDNFNVSYEDDGPRHGLPETPEVFFGDGVDEEPNGINDEAADGDDDTNDPDEDGVVLPNMLFQGEQAIVNLTATNGSEDPAKIVGWIDWNNNDQLEAAEMATAAALLTPGAIDAPVTIVFDVPLNAIYYEDLGARFRISTDPGFLAEMSPDGFLMDGEVEDYLVEVKPLDFGDLPDEYAVSYEEEGPRHGLPEEPLVYLGNQVDEDVDGANSEEANGDDDTDDPDEDGVTLPAMLFRGEAATFEITATNLSADPAKIVAWVDWNNNDQLEASEMEAIDELLPAGATNEVVTITFEVPTDAVYYEALGVRIRISTDPDFMSEMSPTGFLMDGEVEDYLVEVKPLDFGDLPDIFIVEYEEDGPRHGLPEEPLVYIGGIPDEEEDAHVSPSAGAEGDGDDGDNQDDENGVIKPEEIFRGQPATFLVDVVNMTSDQAKLIGFVDWNRDQDFEDEGEMEFVLIDPNTTGQVPVVFDVPQDAGFYLPFTATRFRISTDPAFFTEEGMSPNGFVMDGEVEDCLIEVNPVEYGDLPISYGTLLADDGASHGEVVDGDLFLGTLIDEDFDGQTDAMDMALGDDNDESDDDDGITFLTPLIPGDTAKIRVEVSVLTEIDAYLNAWMDFDGNGTMDATDALAFLLVNDLEIAPTTNLAVSDGTFDLCFIVPADATFAPGGMAYSRFRLSSEGSLEPTGFTEDGEVEDYKVQLAKVGNLVWRDYNYNGIQDEGEPGIETPTEVILLYAGEDGEFFTDDDFESRDITDENGLYYFCGLIEDSESMYKLIVTSDFFPTLANESGVDEDLDSDGEVTSDTTVSMMFLLDDIAALPLEEAGINDDPNDVGNFPDAVTDQTFDQGYAGFDYGDLPDEYLTTDESNEGEGTRHIYFPGKYLGDCIDLDLDGQPSEYGDGDDDNEGVYTAGECEEGGDDEDGITFLTPLIPGSIAKVEITYTNTAGDEPEDAYLNAWIDWNGDGVLDAGDKLNFTLADELPVNSSNLPLPAGEDLTIVACFEVPATAVFRNGNAYSRFRLGCEEDMESFGTVLGGEVEDYVVPLAKIGNLAWYDDNLDGDQDGEAITPQELGVAGVEFILTYAGYEDTEFGNDNDLEYTVLTDENGVYNFCGLIEGKYSVEVQKYDDDELDPAAETPERYILIIPNLGGDDELDSDLAPGVMVMIPDLLTTDLITGEDGYLDNPGENNGFPDERDNLSIDAGWIPEPNVESLLNIAGVDFGPNADENCEEFNIIVDICIKNTGYVEKEGILVGAPLAELSAKLDLEAEMGDAFVGLDGAPELLSELGYDNTILMDMPDGDRLPEINPNYNGNSHTELLDGSGLLYPGENVCIRLNVTMNPELVSMEEAMAIDFQAKVSGLAVNYQGIAIPDYFNGGEQFMSMDLSDDDWSFNGSYDDADDAEAFGNCFKTVQPLVVPLQVNISANADCGVCIDPSEVVLSYQEDCGDDDYPLGGFYRITVPGVAEDLTEVCVDGTDIVDGKFIFSVRTVNAPCNSSWGEVLLEDKYIPTLDCPEDISSIGYQDLICGDIDSLLLEHQESYQVDKEGKVLEISDELKAILDLTGYALAEDNCAGLTVYVSDELLDSEACDEQVIKRTFWVEAEVQGVLETATCMQLIHFAKPELDDVKPPKDVILYCTEEFELNEQGNPHPNETGYPKVKSGLGTYNLAATFCNLGASYKDGERIQVCEGTYKLVRTWEVLDWCEEGYERVREFEQIIKVLDEKGPEVVCVEVDHDHDGTSDLRTYSTGPYDCTASFEVPLPEVSDACSSWSVLTEIITDGVVVATVPAGGPGYVSGIPVGCHEFRYTVIDDCGNKTIIYCPFQVLDQIEPIAVCDDDLNISLGGQSFARVTAEDIDEGSSDNCGSIGLEVRRRILDIESYECLDAFDYDGDGEVIGDEVQLSTEFGDPDGDGLGEEFYYTPWEAYADFNCCDMNETVRIELRVWDDANGSGIFGDEIELPVCFDYAVQTVKDNYNVCWMDVLIEDKVPPICTPPHTVKVNCDELPFDFDPQDEVQMTELFGAPEGFDNCGHFTIEELDADTEGLNDCGSGQFIRNFLVKDAKGIESAACQQIVTVNQVHDYWIKFPADASANCGTPMVDTVLTSEGSCDLLAISVKEEVFSASGDECYKLFRTYSVINWCEYDGESAPVVVSRDEDCDGKPGDEAVYVIVRTKDKKDPCYDYYGSEPEKSYEHVWYDRDNDPFNQLPEAGTKGKACDYTTNPTGFWKELTPITENDAKDKDVDGYPANGTQHCEIASVGYWQYTQVIKVYDDVRPEIEFTTPEVFCSYSSDQENGCPAEVNIDFTIDENCTPEDLTITVQVDTYSDDVIDSHAADLLSGSYPNYQIKGSFPLGQHRFIVTVSDGCGNSDQQVIPFEVADCKAPSPICINGLAIELMPVIPAADADGDGDLDNGAMAIWASDFIASPISDCTGEVSYSINRVGEDNDPAQTGLTLTCEDPASTLVEIWAYDAVGNGDFCETYVLVQANMVQCTAGEGSIAGLITTEETEPVEGVSVELSGGQFLAMDSKVDGQYLFDNLNTGFDYTITPHHDVQPINGVSTFDLVLMSKHILGVQPLDSPYKRIAADINNDKRITAIDAIALRKLILNIDISFPNNTSWRFVPKAYVFPDPENPWQEAFPEIININDLNEDLTEEDFIAVKIGDVDLNARPNSLMTESRTISGLFLLEVDELEMKTGNTYQIDFRAEQLRDIQGYQMTLSLDPTSVSLVDISYGVSTAEHFGLRQLSEGLITTSWNKGGLVSESYNAEDILFSLILQSTADVSLSEVLGVSSRVTQAEAYDLEDGLLEVGIDFNTGLIAKVPFELYQNVPNPFREETSISFYLPEGGQTTLKIHDAGGRVIKLIRSDFKAGLNQITLKRSELAETGMLYYTLSNGEHTASRKMILIK